jgi:cytochrome c
MKFTMSNRKSLAANSLAVLSALLSLTTSYGLQADVNSEMETQQQSSASPTENAMLGKRQFFKCRACHTLGEGEGNLVGPNLYGLIGRKAGSSEDYSYSKALSESNIVWNEKTLNQWIKKPYEMVPGTTMVFAGMESEEDRAALIRHIVRKTSK